jgi:hypothetical protein
VLTLAGLALLITGALLGRDAWSATGLRPRVASPQSRPPPLRALSLSQLSILRI